MLGYGALGEFPLSDAGAGTRVSGFKPVSFGTPSVTFHPVTGFMPVTFGPVSIVQKYVTGFKATSFGAPKAVEVVHPSGFMPVHFGTSIPLLPHAVALRAVHFGPIGLLPHSVALRPVHFGLAVATQRNLVSAWRTATFGSPTMPLTSLVQPTGFQACHFGRVIAVRLTLRRRNLHGMVFRVRCARFGTPTL